jgi:hypothetical protein
MSNKIVVSLYPLQSLPIFPLFQRKCWILTSNSRLPLSSYFLQSSQIHFGFLSQIVKPDSVASHSIYLSFIYLTAGTASAAGIHPTMLISADSLNVITEFINSFHHIHVLCPFDGSTLPHFLMGSLGSTPPSLKKSSAL